MRYLWRLAGCMFSCMLLAACRTPASGPQVAAPATPTLAPTDADPSPRPTTTTVVPTPTDLLTTATPLPPSPTPSPSVTPTPISLEPSWSRSASPRYFTCIDTVHCWALHYISDGNERLELFATDNGGTTWNQLQLPQIDLDSAGIVRFANLDNGWLFHPRRGRQLFVTRDGGQTWAEDPNLEALVTLEVAGRTVWAIAQSQPSPVQYTLLMSTDQGETWHPADAQPPLFGRLIPFSEHDAFIFKSSGNDSKLFATNDGAQSWYELPPPPVTRYWKAALNALDPMQLWLSCIGQGGTRDQGAPRHIYRSFDGGMSWTLVSSTRGTHRPIFPATEQRAFMIPSYAPVLRTDDGGESWEPAIAAQQTWDFGGGSGLQYVLFIDAQHGWAVSGNLLFRTTDGGEEWTESVIR